MAVETTVPGQASPRPRGGPAESVKKERFLVLLVEDDFMLRWSLAEMLTIEGYDVESAANGAEALRRLTRAPTPSVILLDILMPGVDGLQFRALQLAEARIAAIPVIVMTAVSLGPEVAAQLDLRQVFGKPLDRHKLLEAITTACARDGR